MANVSEILRKNVLFNGLQLVEANKKLDEYSILSRGNKINFEDKELTGSEERQSENTLENLHELLKIERVYLANKRSKGIYESGKNRVKITSVVGKLANFGYMENNVIYIKPHEALLLMEMNRLEVTYDTVTMSVEQAYSIFFSPFSNVNLEEYIVYSYLSRIGYIIMEHDAEHDKQKHNSLEEKRKLCIEDEMIWCVLMEKLNLPHTRDVIDMDHELYLKTKTAMEKSSAAISGRTEDQEKSEGPAPKKLKIDTSQSDVNFLDILKTELEFLSYEQLFKKFSYISQRQHPITNDPLDFKFDLFLPKTNFRRTEDLASYRVIIINSRQKFPSISQLQSLYQKQCYRVPLIIAIVSDSFTANFSICNF